MKKSVILFMLAWVWHTSLCQELKPTGDLTLLRIKIQNVEKYINPVLHIVGINSGRQFKFTADASGYGTILLPVAETYVVNHYETMGCDLIHIPNKANNSMDYSIDFSNLPENPLTHAALILYVINERGQAVQYEKVSLVSKKSGNKFIGKTDEKGQLLIRLPVDETFILEFTNAPNYQEIDIPPNHLLISQYEIQYEGSGQGGLQPNLDEALINFTYLNLQGNPVPEEEIIVANQITGEFYPSITTSNGTSQLLVPIGHKYSISIKHYKNFGTQEFSSQQGLYQVDYTIKYISSKEWEEREQERALRIARRDSLFAIRDSLFYMDEEEKYNLQRELWKFKAEQDAAFVKEELKTNPRYFEKSKKAVAAVLYRMRNKWKNKIIVVDLTCSMDPYAEELLLWTALKLSTDEKNQFLFFNDGDGMPTPLKEIGNTGGIHYTDAVILDSIINVMLDTKWTGCSGDQAENDLEALLDGTRYRKRNEELILIADNYSSVRDIELLQKLNVPVRIVLCGVAYGIHEDYLEIAAKTGGSVHTIEEDIMNLAELADGEKINVGGHDYMFTRGKFLKTE